MRLGNNNILVIRVELLAAELRPHVLDMDWAVINDICCVGGEVLARRLDDV
jgi:hypothetical protein